MANNLDHVLCLYVFDIIINSFIYFFYVKAKYERVLIDSKHFFDACSCLAGSRPARMQVPMKEVG